MIKKVVFICSFLLIVSEIIAQKTYFKTKGEYIFANSLVTDNNVPVDSRLRFSFFLNLGEYMHHNFNNNVGIYTGLCVRNIGIITNNNGIETKQRSYAAGVPFAIKIGSFNDNVYLYTGGEYEWLFHYKEKISSGNDISINRKWFSDKTNVFIPSVFVGIQFKYGINIKFKYYMDNYLNPNYVEKTGFISTKPYEKIRSQLFYISVNFNFKKIKKIKKLQPLLNRPRAVEV
ncbi:MAG: hypothetical protein GXO79_09205 [Chlorobi bacterium]|nr:hypothetical protein [Chlorobiota bacterium]